MTPPSDPRLSFGLDDSNEDTGSGEDDRPPKPERRPQRQQSEPPRRKPKPKPKPPPEDSSASETTEDSHDWDDTPAPKRTPASRNKPTRNRSAGKTETPRVVSAPRTAKGGARVYTPNRTREIRAKVVLGVLVLLALVGLVNSCQGIISSDETTWAAESHSHADVSVIWGDIAQREAELYVAGEWDAMMPFPLQSTLADSSTGEPLDVQSSWNQKWSREGTRETHEVLVVTADEEGRVSHWAVKMVLTADGFFADTIAHVVDPQVSPSSERISPSGCVARNIKLPDLALEVVGNWAEAWLASDVPALVQIAGATEQGTSYPGYGPPLMGFGGLLSVRQPCAVDGQDFLTVSMVAVDCNTGKSVVVSQNISLLFRNTPLPQIPAWSPVGEVPAPRGAVDDDNNFYGTLDCEGMRTYNRSLLDASSPPSTTLPEIPLPSFGASEEETETGQGAASENGVAS